MLGRNLRFLVIALALAASRGGAQEPAVIIRGPYLQRVLAESASVLWATDVATTGALRIWPEGDEGAASDRSESVPTTLHRIDIDGLDAATRYRYRVGDGPEFTFRTPPSPGTGDVLAVVIGDSGEGDSNQSDVTTLVETLDSSLLLHTGDLVYNGDREGVVFAEYQSLMTTRCFYPTRGNHARIPFGEWWPLFPPPDIDPPSRIDCSVPALDCGPPSDTIALPEPPLPQRTGGFYSFDWGPAHIAVLDSNSDGDFAPCGAQQIRWLCADLADARDRGMPWLILSFHHHPYTSGSNCVSSSPARDHIPLIADAFGVDLVLSGHDHNYQRTYPIRGDTIFERWQEPRYTSPRGTVYLVTGGGGTRLYGPCNPEWVRCDDRCRSDLELFRVFHKTWHVVELHITESRLEARAIAAVGERRGEVLDSFSILKDVPREPLAFLRGDIDGDGGVAINDAIATLNYLFLGGELACPPIADVQDDGAVDIADPIFLLGFLFLGTEQAPAPPFPICGPLKGGDANDSTCERAGCKA